jgi:hypothetical protein
MRAPAEDRFDGVLCNLDAVARYARRRGARDPDDVAGECMTIAWRRLDDIPAGDALPRLLGCARRVVLAQCSRLRTPLVRATRTPPFIPWQS